MRLNSSKILALIVCAAAVAWFTGNSLTAAVDPHAYFNTLTAMPQNLRSFSLRTQSQIDFYSQAKPNQWVTYDAAMDAAKAVIPPFVPHRGLAADVDATTNILPFSSTVNTTLMVAGKQLKVDDEIVTIYKPSGATSIFPSNTSVYVQRGQFKTTATSHSAGASALLSNNNLLNQVRLPVGTEDGHNYFIVWDMLYASSYLGYNKGAKSYQLSDAASKDALWFETRANSNADGIGSLSGLDRSKYVGLLSGRSYNSSLPTSSGSNVTGVDPVKPQVNRFYIHPDRWIRIFVYVDQRGDGFDLLSMWAADEQTDPVPIFNESTVVVRGTPATIRTWWIELNTSQDGYKGSLDPLVSYARNFLVLKDVSSPTNLLQRPLSSGTLPTSSSSGPKPPTNVRVVK